MRIYIEGHAKSLGYAVSIEWSNAECSRLAPLTVDAVRPVKFIINRAHAYRLVARWNRRFATHIGL